MTTIISALISAGVTLAVCLITQHAESAKTTAVIEVKLDELNRRVSAHNNLVDRTYKLEEENKVQDEQIKQVTQKISELEKGGKYATSENTAQSR